MRVAGADMFYEKGRGWEDMELKGRDALRSI
jgi:hypothetical protein